MTLDHPLVKDFSDQLSQFVKEVCQDRDDSHGHNHMQKVASTSLKIFIEIFGDIIPTNLDIAKLTLMVAWLHDVNDHKYHNDQLAFKLKDFIHMHSPNNVDLILKIIQHISYSTEVKLMQSNNNKKVDFDKILGATGSMVRDIVSDADKLEALGSIGLERCIDYQKHLFYQKHQTEIPIEILKQETKQHAEEKLLRLSDHFIRTSMGKKLAQPLHDEFVLALNQFLSL